MTHEKFNEFLENCIKEIRNVLASKSADYSSGDDKLFNFKESARIDGITPVEALRGMHLKHRTSIKQGLDDLQQGKIRPLEWWKEKLGDDRNYNILLEALITETYFGE